MPVAIPTALPVAGGWQFFDWIEAQRRSRPAAGGVATIELEQLGSDEMWLIDRAVVVCDSTAATTVRLYVDGVDPQRLRSGSTSGGFDEAEYPNGLLLRSSSRLVARWEGCTAGAVGTLTLQARVFRRV